MLPYLPIIGGAQTQTHGLATAISKLGHQVTVYASKKCVTDCIKLGWKFNYRIKTCSSAKYPIFKINSKLWNHLTFKEINKNILRDDLDVIQLIMSWPWVCVAKKIKKYDRPIVLRTAGDDIQIDSNINYGVRLNNKRNKLIMNGFKYVDSFVAISNTIKEEYLKLNIPSKKIASIENGINAKSIKEQLVDIHSIRKKYKLPLDKKIILSVGRNHPKKGFKDLIDSLAYLNKLTNDYIVLLIGEKTNELISYAKYKNQEMNFFQINQINPSKNEISFPTNELINLYKSSNYFVLPSYVEGHPNVVVEASMSGLPVIVTDAPGCRDVVNHEIDGLIVSVNSPQEISNAIERLEKNSTLRKKIIKASYIKLLERDWSEVANKYISLYKQLTT